MQEIIAISLMQSLWWPALQIHRKCALMYKLLHNFLTITSNYFPATSPITTSHDFKLTHYQPALDCDKCIFQRKIPEWNILQAKIALEPTLDKFKKSLHNYPNMHIATH